MRNSLVGSGVESSVIRLRLSGPVAVDPSSPLDWRLQVWLLSSLFFNMPFFCVYGAGFWMEWPLPQYSVILVVVALFVAGVFFLMPALAVHAARKSLFETLADSIGSLPALGVRLCGIALLFLWIGGLFGVSLNLVSSAMDLWDSPLSRGLVCVATLCFLCFTGVQSEANSAKLAFLSAKFGLAILIAGLVRVHEAWPAIPYGFQHSGISSDGMDIWRRLSELVAYLAPLCFFAAAWGPRTSGRKQIVAAALLGLALPLLAVLLLLGVMNVATAKSAYYQPSLDPNITMALWGQTARSAIPGRMLIVSVTVFGVVRFGIRALADSAALFSTGRVTRWLMVGAFIAVSTVLSMHAFDPTAFPTRTATTHVLVVASAILTADWLLKHSKPEGHGRWDWAGCTALGAGLAAPWYLPAMLVGSGDDVWWYRSLLPSYGMTLLACVIGRAVERAVVARHRNPPGLVSP
ncbi:hypothetical protein [uncultured Paludibaculum sp.]|uniref:hypothetical protein n=1 Tax=uncultured Paludibaculum sp. TaxID=1765020 RepID=UPI002AAABE0E|nr:hypothetical protein [uncultured Paludibaculum sp.]